MENNMINESLAPMVKAIRAYALEHYNEGGWDYVVECWSDLDIEMAILPGDGTLETAIKNVGSQVGVLDSVRKDIQGEIF
jgi:hypothetical protein